MVQQRCQHLFFLDFTYNFQQHKMRVNQSKTCTHKAIPLFNLTLKFSGEESRRRGKRSATSPAKKIINDIKQTIGDSQFDKLMALDGMVTLAFAIDTTGSMSSEISDAINLATTITNWPRTFEVDYILSPFNDRSTSSFVPSQSIFVLLLL